MNVVVQSPSVSDSLWPHRLQHARPPCPWPSPGVHPSSCPLHQRCHPATWSSDTLFSFCPQSFPASGTFPMSRLFSSDDQNAGVSASTSVLSRSIQGWFSLRLIGLILLSKGLSGVFSRTTVRRHQFFSTAPSLRFSSHNCTRLKKKMNITKLKNNTAGKIVPVDLLDRGLPWTFKFLRDKLSSKHNKVKYSKMRSACIGQEAWVAGKM